jgi:PAS domain S-box-containing protein
MVQDRSTDSLINWDAQVSLKLLVESAPIALAIVDRAGRIIYVNGKLEALFGYDREEILGEAVEVLLPHRFQGVHVQHRQGYMQHPRERSMGSGMDLAGRRKDGSEFPLEAGLSYLKIGDEMVVIATITDISRRKQTEEILEQRVEERTHEIERRQRVSDGMRDILSMLNSNHTWDKVLDHIAQQAMELLSAQACAFYHLQAEDRLPGATAGQTFLVSDPHPPSFSLLEGIDAGATNLDGRPVVIRDLAHIPQENEPLLNERRQWLLARGCRALLAVPLLIKDEVSGSLVLYYAQRHDFAAEEIELAQVLGNQAALALENARLRTQRERTAVTAERNRLARDLHDAVTQTLFSSSMIAEVLPRIWRRDAAEGERRLAELRELTRGALAEMRTLLLELRPAKLIEIDIADLLRQLAEAIAGRARVAASVQLEGDAELPVDVKIAFYRIAQEALNNVSKHAQARQALIQLRRQPDLFELTITDDGSGFVFDRIRPQHLGLGIMRERADAVGATLHIESRPGQGAKITVRWRMHDSTASLEGRTGQQESTNG